MKLNQIFEKARRDDGSEYYRQIEKKGQRHDLIQNWAHKSHGDLFPHDLVYAMLDDVATWFIDAAAQDSPWESGDDADTLEAIRDMVRDSLSGMVVYTSTAKKWFAECKGDDWIDEMIGNYGYDVDLKSRSIISLIEQGFCYHYEQMIDGFPLEELLAIDNLTD